MELKRALSCALLLSSVAVSLLGQMPTATNTWVDSPEAIFLTTEERAEWWSLQTDAERDAFKERYWAQRDPTPDTPKNEFKDVILSRIATADKRFPIDKTPGSQTARGFVFILLGSPAHVQDATAGSVPGQPPSMIGSETAEVAVTWLYDKLRTPNILEMLNRPELSVSFIIQPNRRRDQLINPGLINGIRDALAARSIARHIPLSAIRKVDVSVEPLPGPALAPDIKTQLDAITSSTTSLHSASIWNADGSPTTLFWLVTPEAAPGGPPTLSGRIQDGDGKAVATISRTVRAAAGFTLGGHGVVLAWRIPLQSGTYQTAFVAQQPGLSKTLAAATGRVVVPAKGPGLAVSSLLLTDTLTGVTADSAAFAVGAVAIRPRADALFMTSESLWYAFQVMNPSNPDAARLTVTLRRRDATSVQATELPAGLQKVGDHLYFGAYELPLSALAPGDYSLYLTVSDTDGAEQVRRADFTLAAASVR